MCVCMCAGASGTMRAWWAHTQLARQLVDSIGKLC